MQMEPMCNLVFCDTTDFWSTPLKGRRSSKHRRRGTGKTSQRGFKIVASWHTLRDTAKLVLYRCRLMHKQSNRKSMTARRVSDLNMTSSEAFSAHHSCIQVCDKPCTPSCLLRKYNELEGQLAPRSNVSSRVDFPCDIVFQAKSCSCCLRMTLQLNNDSLWS